MSEAQFVYIAVVIDPAGSRYAYIHTRLRMRIHDSFVSP